jgi:uncharacterized protein YgbK (DUF1537 family)
MCRGAARAARRRFGRGLIPGRWPPLRVEPDARALIRQAHRRVRRRIAVLDDDPTGSQTVHDVTIVTGFAPEDYRPALASPGATCFVLTNTRSMDAPQAAALNHSLGRGIIAVADELGGPVQIVSRSDSTLRGHLFPEVNALDAARKEHTGRGYDGVLLVPAFVEAGRVTAGDVHWARVGDRMLPVGETEFARDATFGYRASNLRDYVAEKSGGAIGPTAVHSIGLHDVRLGGPSRVADILMQVTDGAFVVVNATDYADLEVVVLGMLAAEDAGRSFLSRVGPSFPGVLAGLPPRPPLTTATIWPGGRPPGHGLVVVGSHVGLTSRQIEVARRRGGLVEVELQVDAVLDDRASRHLAEVVARVTETLTGADALLFTSRSLIRGSDAAGSLDIARRVSDAVVEVVRGVRAAKPAWVVAKGGITSHDTAVGGLEIRRAEVVGQMLPGLVSVLRPVDAPPEMVGVPYVVFAGNVGDNDTLAYVIDVLRGGDGAGGPS